MFFNSTDDILQIILCTKKVLSQKTDNTKADVVRARLLGQELYNLFTSLITVVLGVIASAIWDCIKQLFTK